MAYKIGKVIDFDKYVGNIITEDGDKYIFLKNDVTGEIDNGSLVAFSPERVDDVKRAFFVKDFNLLYKRSEDVRPPKFNKARIFVKKK